MPTARFPQFLAVLTWGCLWFPARAQLERVNVAKLQAAQASSAATGDPAVFATDGIVGNGNRWKSGEGGPHWLSVTLPLVMEVGSAHLYLGRDDIEAVASFSLQWWNGTAWANIPGTTVSGNTENVLNLVFPETIRTSRVRFYSTENVVRMREMALFPPNGPDGYPIGIDVTLNLARKRPATATSIDADNYPKNAVDGYVDDASRWKSADVNGPHRIEVDLELSSRLGSAHIYFGTTAPPVADFTFEWWNGSTWTAIPGGVVTGNSGYARQVAFTTPISTSRVRLSIAADGAQRVRELVIFAANGGDAYPLGTDAVVAPHPDIRFDTYGDGFWKIVNRTNPHSLIVSGAGASQTIPETTEEEKFFQILYNIDSDSFRLRNRDSYLCIGSSNAGKTAGSAVVEIADYQAMPHELWRFEDMGGGYVRIANLWSGLVMQTDGLTPAAVTLEVPSSSTRQQWRLDFQTHYPKKGTAGYEGEWQRLGTSWSYNWGRDTGASQPSHFVFTPMQYGRWWPNFNTLPEYYSAWHTTSKPLVILGYNEPESADQGNTPVDEGVALWRRLEQTDMPLVSPAPVNPFTPWINEFYSQVNAQGLRVDFTAIHWYANPNADGLINHLQNVFNTYGRPVWLTEFSNIDWSGNANWTDEDCYRFITEFTWRAEDLTWLKRYSIFPVRGDLSTNPWDRQGDSSHFFLSDGLTLTPFGEFYAAWDADRILRDRTSYFINGLGSMHRLRASSTTNAPSTGNIRRADVSAQFALVPNLAEARHYVVSLRDGRRLRFDGTLLDLAPPGSAGSTVEWTFNGPDSRGYILIDHPASSKSLRLSRTNDGNGAPAALNYGMEPFGTAQDNTRWRFIKPHQPLEVSAPSAPSSLTATAGGDRITLSWPVSAATDFLRYAVYRSDASRGPYTRIEPTLTASSYVDTNVAEGASYYYVVTTTDWIENESAYSPEATARLGPAPGSYAFWAAAAFAANPTANADFNGDSDRDGLENGVEYLFSSDPLIFSPSSFSAGRDAAGQIVITYTRNRSASDLQLDIEASSTLGVGTWQVVAVEIVSQTADGAVDRMRVRPQDVGGRTRYYRLRARISPP
ncbi:MAG: glycosyl hydrolase [Verrucomicrobiales bacterium]